MAGPPTSVPHGRRSPALPQKMYVRPLSRPPAASCSMASANHLINSRLNRCVEGRLIARGRNQRCDLSHRFLSVGQTRPCTIVHFLLDRALGILDQPLGAFLPCEP